MSNEKFLTSRTGAFRGTADFRTGKYSDGTPLDYPADVYEYEATGAVSQYNLVKLVAPSAAGVQPRVGPWVQASDSQSLILGVAQNATTAAGDRCSVVVKGFTLVNVAAATPAANNLATGGASDGKAGVLATPDATTIVGTSLGVFMGAKDASNNAWLYFEHR